MNESDLLDQLEEKLRKFGHEMPVRALVRDIEDAGITDQEHQRSILQKFADRPTITGEIPDEGNFTKETLEHNFQCEHCERDLRVNKWNRATCEVCWRMYTETGKLHFNPENTDEDLRHCHICEWVGPESRVPPLTDEENLGKCPDCGEPTPQPVERLEDRPAEDLIDILQKEWETDVYIVQREKGHDPKTRVCVRNHTDEGLGNYEKRKIAYGSDLREALQKAIAGDYGYPK